jgi:hypothetical protein
MQLKPNNLLLQGTCHGPQALSMMLLCRQLKPRRLPRLLQPALLCLHVLL